MTETDNAPTPDSGGEEVRERERLPWRRFTWIAASGLAAGWLAVGVLLTLLVLHGPSGLSRYFDTAKQPEIRYAWAQLVSDQGETKVAVRVIVPSGAGCRNLARLAGGVAEVDFVLRSNSAQDRFPIDLCQAELRLKDKGVALSNGTELSWETIAKDAPTHVVVIGDTGCRVGEKQICGNGDTWALPKIAAAASSGDGQAPDLTIHVGDIRYHGTDTWAFWEKDFFEPMRPLLEAAPMIIVRGNHDNCFKGKGFGWKYFLAPTVPFEDCKNIGKADEIADVEEPYAVDLGSLRIVVLDNADSYYRCQSWNAFMSADNGKPLDALKHLIDNARGSVWFVSHYPIFDLRNSGACEGPKDASFFALHERISPLLTGSAKIDAVLSGDIHHFEILHARNGSRWQTLQFVVGNSGTKLDNLSEPDDIQKNGTCKSGPPQGTMYCANVALDRSRGYPAGKLEVDARLRKIFGFVVANWDSSVKHWQFQMRAMASDRQVTELSCQVPVGTSADCVKAKN